MINILRLILLMFLVFLSIKAIDKIEKIYFHDNLINPNKIIVPVSRQVADTRADWPKPKVPHIHKKPNVGHKPVSKPHRPAGGCAW